MGEPEGLCWVQNREGGGASFRVLIPRGDPEVAPQSAGPGERP
jgi:hypothetical protein